MATRHRRPNRGLARRTARKAAAPLYRLLHPRKPAFTCPICNYQGPFRDKRDRRHAKCPSCGALERTRLLFAVLSPLLESFSPERKRVLHIAPEAQLDEWLRGRFGHYVSGDLQRMDVNARVDIQHLPFPDATFDLVVASHVLEYPEDDRKAIAEVQRVLRADGIAALPVPLMHFRTRDLPARDATTRVMHEPGLDYFQRMEANFAQVHLHRSDEVNPAHQPFIHAPTDKTPPLLVHQPNVRLDVVPICLTKP
ncbi:MAG: methyltransferase domain-containing protein [Gammaproteobacteria bacterium]|nr:methyltransferase domain-containing protein [Gammaproteobacteria bacterium]